MRAAGGVCVVDEVQSGFGRTGDHLWAFEGHGVIPDIVVMAKGMGNGYPIGAVVARKHVSESMAGKFCFHTYGASPLTCTAGRATLNVLRQEKLQENARVVGAALLERLGALKRFVAVDSILSFHERTAGNDHVLMVAYNSHFDAAFLDHLFRSAKKTWREMYYYFILDIPSMAWGLGLEDLNSSWIMEHYGVKDEPHIADQHTGITGAMVNVRIYRALLQYRQDLLSSVPIP